MVEGKVLTMLRWISILGGLLIMMGHHARSEALFYYFRLEDQVSENHLLRLIDKHISFEFVREQLRDSYSEAGRPSIDPELLLRMLLIGYLYGITSERKLVEELRMHLAWRWFTGLGFDQEIPHHSTFSKNRHGRFQESKLFEQLFERIVKQCVEVGLVRGSLINPKATPLAPAQTEVRARAVLLSGSCAEHQTVGPLPQPRAKTAPRRDRLVSNPGKKLFPTAVLTPHQLPLLSSPFSTPTGVYTN
jgi:transposase